MGFTSAFKNFGHAIATGAKYFVTGVTDVVKVAGKAQVAAPELDLLVGALAGPQAAKISDLAFHALGDVASALEKVGNDVQSQQGTVGLNVALDLQAFNDIKAAVGVIKGLIAAHGAEVPQA